MNMKQLVLVSLLFGSTAIPLSAERKKTTHATKTEQNWWQRRSPEFKAFIITAGTITGVCLMRYGWVKGMQWLEAKRAAQRARNTRWQDYEYRYNTDDRSYTVSWSSGSRRGDARREMQARNQRAGFSTITELQSSYNELPSEALDTYTHSLSGTSGWDNRQACVNVPSTLTQEEKDKLRANNTEIECAICAEQDTLPDEILDGCKKGCNVILCSSCKANEKNNLRGCPMCRCRYYEF